MKCAICNTEISAKTAEFEFKSRSLGKILIPDITYFECVSCGNKILSPNESDKVINYVEKEENKAISKLPIGDFITANEAAEILGITKQAFSKHAKIKRGLIYSVKIGDRKYYNHNSVELFKEKNNGKFLLSKPDVTPIYTKKEILEHHMPKRFKILKTQKTIYSHRTFISHKQKDVESKFSGLMYLISMKNKGIRNVYR
jgi:YgiT-type zinc finger domain-containing protein